MEKKNFTKVAFRTDGSPQIGMGHVMRCIALAKELQRYDTEIFFISKSNSKVKDLVLNNNFKLLNIKESSQTEELYKVKYFLDKYNINIAITDSYCLDTDYLANMAKLVDVLVTIDDFNRISYPSHIVINGNIYATTLDYSSIHGNTDFLLGCDYILMREEFVDVTGRRLSETVREILVTVGGSDPLNLTPIILQSLGQLDTDLEIKVVIGPGFENQLEITNTAHSIRKKIELLTNVENVAVLMLSCDMAVTAGGTTLYELARTGTPAVVLLQADNQVLAADGMNRIGSIINLGMGKKVTVSGITSAVEKLCQNWYLRQEMSRRGQSLVDGLGASRCARVIMQKFQALSGKILTL